MKYKSYIFLLFLSVLPLTFTACESEPAQIDITLESDYSGMLAAIRGVDKTLSEKLALIESAWDSGLADNQQALKLIRELVASLEGTLEEQLSSIAAAMQSQTAGLETKLALVEEAVRSGFADSQAQQALLQQAVASLGGTMEEKLAAIEAALQSRTADLETKLGLIEAAARSSAEASGRELELIRTALSSLEGTLQNKQAAIDTALTKETTDLETKCALIEAALEESLLGEKAAVAALQTALAASLDSLDASLVQVGDEIVAQLDSLASQLTPEEFAKAFQGVRDAVSRQTQSTTGLLAALQRALVELEEAIVPFRLKYLGEPTLTTSSGGTWNAEFQVEPASAVINESMLKLDVLSKLQFFPTWGQSYSGAESPGNYSLSLTADPAVEGKYVVKISCEFPYVVWDESTVTLSAAYGNTQKPKYITSDSFKLVMVPKPLKGLKYWTYPAASFTFKRGGSVNNIYYALDSGIFETKDGSDTRTYNASFIDSVRFVPANEGMAPMFIQLDKEKKMIVFIPDTAGITYTQSWPDAKDPSYGWQIWHNFKDSSGVKHESLLGKLVLTDRWHVKDTIQIRPEKMIGWYNAVWFPESAIVGVNDIQGDNTAVVDIRSLLSKLGLERSWLEGRFILQEQYGDLEGPYFKMSAQLLPETLKLAVKFQADPVPGAKFGLTAHYDLWTFPTETDPQFKILALSFSYSLIVTIVN